MKKIDKCYIIAACLITLLNVAILVSHFRQCLTGPAIDSHIAEVLQEGG